MTRLNSVRLKYLRQGGKYILDVASGGIPQPEYLQYSEAFEKRICIDLSFVALQQARKKLGSKGIYILGDITNLPLRDDALRRGDQPAYHLSRSGRRTKLCA